MDTNTFLFHRLNHQNYYKCFFPTQSFEMFLQVVRMKSIINFYKFITVRIHSRKWLLLFCYFFYNGFLGLTTRTYGSE